MTIEKEAIIIRKRNEKCNYTKILFHQACWQKPRLIQSLSDRMPVPSPLYSAPPALCSGHTALAYLLSSVSLCLRTYAPILSALFLECYSWRNHLTISCPLLRCALLSETCSDHPFKTRTLHSHFSYSILFFPHRALIYNL